jgi:hypothetical protein
MQQVLLERLLKTVATACDRCSWWHCAALLAAAASDRSRLQGLFMQGNGLSAADVNEL